MIGFLRRETPLEKKIGYRFRNRKLLHTALVHPSFRFEKHPNEEDNQRMEFLGDAVLGLLVASYSYEKFKDEEEGFLTALRSRITNGRALAKIAAGIGIDADIKLGRGEEMSGGRRRGSTLADAIEAVVGAAWLDGGITAAEKVFRKVFLSGLESCAQDFWADNPKGQLQDVAQRVLRGSPQYRTVKEEGPSHARRFTVEVVVHGNVLGRGAGANRRQAEVHAATEALEALAAKGMLRGRGRHRSEADRSAGR